MDSKRVMIGDKVKFKRFGHPLVGEVSLIREESVIVKLDQTDAETLKLDTPLTVVSHKNYTLI
jgi:uncharacterized protein YkvS